MAQPLVLSPGQRVGPYTVVSPLRAGGMATLYLARRVGPAGFARPVALKVVHAHLGRDPQFVQMFLDEALLCARIRHPNVVHVEELGEHGGSYFLAMEYVDGCSLEDVFDRLCALGERIPPRLAVSIACWVLEGLYATHTLAGDRGEPLHVVHRDVSPSNVLIDRAGHVKLIDFGVAKARGRAVETSAGTLKGKYAYMSPEQAFGRSLDLRSDLYSLAVVLWEMLAMRPLFSADTDLALLELARAPSIPSLRASSPDVPEALERVLASALAPRAEDRPSSARELRQRLLDAYPEARSVDPAELGGLVERLLGPVRAPDEVNGLPPDLALGSTVSSTPAGQSSPEPQPVAQPAGTRAGPSPRRRLGALLAAAVVLAVIAAALFVATREGTPTNASVPAPPSARTPAAEPEPTHPPVPSLSEPPRVAPTAATPADAARPEASTGEAAPRLPPAPKRKPRDAAAAHRDPAPPSSPVPPPQAPAGPPKAATEVHGVPLVENPAF